MKTDECPFRDELNMRTWECMELTVEPEKKISMMFDKKEFHLLHRSIYHSGTSSISLTENFMSFPFAFEFRSFSPFYESFNENLIRMVAAGFLEKIDRVVFHYDGIKRPNAEPGPQILTMDQIGVGFLVCLIPLSLSIIAFIAEVSIPHLISFWRSLKHTVVAYFVVKAFIKVRSAQFGLKA